MNNFIVSARKYRPSTFQSVVGQGPITTTLKNAISINHLAQAFLFCGPRGVGKTTCARILAKTINCVNLTKETEACNECEQCASFNNGQSLNIHELDAASNNSVDDIRNLIDQVRFAPQSGDKKVYIIDEVHMLSQAAFNAFLKTLEEPPPHAIFILATTEKHKIIPTILSRCQIFDFSRISVVDIAKHLENIASKEHITAETDGLHIIAQKADGALRDALSIFDQLVSFSGNNLTYDSVIENLNVLDYDYYFKTTDAINNNNIPECLLLFDKILANGFDGHNFINGLAEHFRNLLVCKDPSTFQLLQVGDNVRQRYAEQSAHAENQRLLNGLELISKCDINYKTSKNARLLVELTLMQLCSIGMAFEKKNSVETITATKPLSINQKTTISGTQEAQPKPNNINTAKREPSQTASIKQNEPSSTPSITNNESRTDQDLIQTKKPTITSPTTKNLLKTKTVSIMDALVEEPAVPLDIVKDQIPVNTPKDKFSEDDLLAHWKTYAKQIKEEGAQNFYQVMRSKPSLKNEHHIEVVLENKALIDELNSRKTDLLDYLRNQCNNHEIQLSYSVAESKGKKRLFTATDKYQRMAEKNPNITKLRDSLDLDIDL